ncbi:hypothetical protein ADK57_03250 [Streptomyces sp. MMG1533]|nr:hypothetical protein ADK57_03250 [Streptomyces sp. MMG1533]
MEAGEVEAATLHLAGGDSEEIESGLTGRFRGGLLDGEESLAMLAVRQEPRCQVGVSLECHGRPLVR